MRGYNEIYTKISYLALVKRSRSPWSFRDGISKKNILSWRTNSELIVDKLFDMDIEITELQAKALAKAIRAESGIISTMINGKK